MTSVTLSNCPVCSGLLLPDEDDLRCVNCGRRFYPSQPSTRVPIRVCQDCKTDISGLGRVNAVRCLSCIDLANDAASAWKNLKTEMEPWEEPEPVPEPEPEPPPPEEPMPVPEPEPEPPPPEEPMPVPEPESSPPAGKPTPRLPIRVCRDCKRDISGRRWNCVRCVECQKATDKATTAQANQETHRRRQERFGTALVECLSCRRKFVPGRGMQTHQRRSHADSSTPPKGETRSCQDCGGDISDRSPESSRCLPCQTNAESVEPIEPAEHASKSVKSESEHEYTPTPLDDLVDKLLTERSFGGKGHTISGENIVLAYIDVMIVVEEGSIEESQKNLAALYRVKALLVNDPDEGQNQPAASSS